MIDDDDDDDERSTVIKESALPLNTSFVVKYPVKNTERLKCLTTRRSPVRFLALAQGWSSVALVWPDFHIPWILYFRFARHQRVLS